MCIEYIYDAITINEQKVHQLEGVAIWDGMKGGKGKEAHN